MRVQRPTPKVCSDYINESIIKVLSKWQRAIIDYSDNHPEDSLHFYNERASVSVFAGALWSLGNYALEAYGDEKKTGPGRVDLFFCLGEDEYVAEAKYREPSLSPGATSVADVIKRGFSEARKDIANLHKDYSKWGMTKVGILFLSPYLPSSREDLLNQKIKYFYKEIDSLRADFKATVFPKSLRSRLVGDRLYPGAAVIGKRVR